MPVLLHLCRGDERAEVLRVTELLAVAQDVVPFHLRVVPQRSAPGTMVDLRSDSVLCVEFARGHPPWVLQAFRWAVHSRFKPRRDVQARLLCDLRGGDESRTGKQADAKRRRQRGKRAGGW